VLGLLLTLVFRAVFPVNAVPVQPLAVAIVLLALTPATVLACVWPARRAARIDPNDALRGD